MEEKLKLIQEENVWYADGLSFQCTECGQCCTGSPGYTWISVEEIIAAADFLNITVDEFSQKFIRLVDERYSLLEDYKSFDCIFLKNKKCQIYAVRPNQCRTFPWWKKNLNSLEDWNNAAKFCEGITPLAKKNSFEEIQKQISTN